jgi:hypothetical protein
MSPSSHSSRMARVCLGGVYEIALPRGAVLYMLRYVPVALVFESDQHVSTGEKHKIVERYLRHSAHALGATSTGSRLIGGRKEAVDRQR